MLIIKLARFTAKDAKQERYIFRYLRRNVIINLRNLCNLRIRIAKRLLFADTSARTERFAFLRASPLAEFPARHDAADVTQGRIWGQEDAPPLGFTKAASET